MRVVHVINCLSVGGAERALVRLAAARDRDAIDATIVTLLDRDALRGEAEAAGVPVRCAGLSRTRPSPGVVLRLARILREERPDVVHSWLYYANAATTLARPLARGRWPLCWNIRQTIGAIAEETPTLRGALRLNAWLSTRPEVVVANSSRALEDHRRLGFRPRRAEVIPNGLDVASMPHGPEARAAARAALGLAPDALVVAAIGRDHPMKGHAHFVEAVAQVAAREPRLVALLIGRGLQPGHATLAPALAARGLGARVRLLGERSDVPSLLPGLDLLVSSSVRGEAFPNVVAEAMAAGVPVVATDVGESRELVGSTGLVVPPGDAGALAAAIAELLERGAPVRAALGAAARARIATHYGIDAMAARYAALWRSVV